MSAHRMADACDIVDGHAILEEIFEIQAQAVADIFDVLYQLYVARCSAHRPIINPKEIGCATFSECITYEQRHRRTVTSLRGQEIQW